MLAVANVSVSFGFEKVLENISFTLERGQRVAMLGASGAGKTTLLRVIAGLLRPDQGSVELDGWPIWNSGTERQEMPRGVWPKLTMVFQDFKLFPNLTGLDNCILGLTSDTQIDYVKRIEVLAKSLGVEQSLVRRPLEMSQGQRQRIAIIRGLVRSPTFLLLDEPTSALDRFACEALIGVIKQQCANDEIGILFASHDWEFAAKLASEYLVLRSGRAFRVKSLADAVRVFENVA
jgi:polar amino acid transport system ATP-binding protein